MDDSDVFIIEVVGEGKTDIGPATPNPVIELPTTGVVPILLHKLCGLPATMRVKRRKESFLQGKTLEQKVKFSKRQANYNGAAGFVCVFDTEGDHPAKLQEICRGRDAEHHNFPAAVGVAHPCIEAWLLSDGKAIARGTLQTTLPVAPPARPEDLPAPCRDKITNPKLVLGRCAGESRPLAMADTSAIAAHIQDLDLLRARCPMSFASFADEVEARIRPIFADAG